MPFNTENFPQYVDQLLAEAELSAEDRERIKKLTATDKVVAKANELTVPRPDYSSSLDQQRSKHDQERDLWTKEKTEYRKWYEVQQERIKKFEAENGGNPNNARETSDPNLMRKENGQFITKADLEALKTQWQEELEKRFTSQGEAVIGVSEDYITLAEDYRSRFGKPLPVEEIRKKAISEGTNLRQAYKEFIAPDLEKKQKETFDAAIKQAKEEGAREALSRVTNPSHPGSLEGHPVFSKRDLPQDWSKMTPEQREEHSLAQFSKHYEETAGFTKPS